MWIDLGIIVITLLSSLMLPYIVYDRIKTISFNPENQTLSYLGNRRLFGKKMSEGYTEVLFVIAILTLGFFWLLIHKFNFTNHNVIWEWLILAVVSIILLALVHHNMQAFSRKNFYLNLIRILHNVVAVLVFISLPVLMYKFDVFLFHTRQVVAVMGYCIISCTIVAVVASVIIKRKMTGVSELVFIAGISAWNLITGIVSLL